ncbi:MAG: hypothetical protein O2931_16355 [Planctomycetota bacterium]|nr:hypothetical protein [Planctomycetota bacterium]MDA1180354.1 hypothetical protein [Planctomycetota bacterium]
MTLPDRLVQSLLKNAFHLRYPAFLAVTRQGVIRQVGGHWNHYAIAVPRIMAPACVELPFLVGLIPLLTPFEFLPRLNLGQDRFVDIYLLPDEDLDWVLLVDAGDQSAVQQSQQARLESQQPTRARSGTSSLAGAGNR